MRTWMQHQRSLALVVVAMTGSAWACQSDAPSRDPKEQVDETEDEQPVGSRDAAASKDAKVDGGAIMKPAADDEDPDSEDDDDDEPGPEPNKGDDTGQGEQRSDDKFFRVDKFVLKSPGVVLRPAGVELRVTSQAQMGIDDGLVGDIDPDNNNDGKADEGDGDGFVDLSLLIRFVGTEAPAKKAGSTTFGGGQCPHPYTADKACGPSPGLPFQETRASYTNGSDCKLEGTSYTAAGACFLTQKGEILLSLPLLGDIPLEAGQVVGSWVDGGEGGIAGGVIRGFLPESTARATKLGSDLPPLAVTLGIKAGTALAEFLPNGERTTNADNVAGWWFQLEFTAKPALFDERVK